MATKSGTPLTQSSASPSAPLAPKRPRTLAGSPQAADANARKQTLALYESALRLMQSGKYEKAHIAFSK